MAKGCDKIMMLEQKHKFESVGILSWWGTGVVQGAGAWSVLVSVTIAWLPTFIPTTNTTNINRSQVTVNICTYIFTPYFHLCIRCKYPIMPEIIWVVLVKIREASVYWGCRNVPSNSAQMPVQLCIARVEKYCEGGRGGGGLTLIGWMTEWWSSSSAQYLYSGIYIINIGI